MKTLQTRFATAFLLAIMLCAPACTRSRITLGHPVHSEDARAIVPGQTKAAVLERLGPPDRAEPEPGGSIFEYLYSRTAGRALDVSILQGSFSYEESFTKLDRLRVSFDRDGIVRHVAIVKGEVPGDG